jgi:hypothetical protein
MDLDGARLTLEVLFVPIRAVAKFIERREFDVAQMSISQVFLLSIKLAKLIPALHRCERMALGLELVDPTKDQARGPRLRKTYLTSSASKGVAS